MRGPKFKNAHVCCCGRACSESVRPRPAAPGSAGPTAAIWPDVTCDRRPADAMVTWAGRQAAGGGGGDEVMVTVRAAAPLPPHAPQRHTALGPARTQDQSPARHGSTSRTPGRRQRPWQPLLLPLRRAAALGG